VRAARSVCWEKAGTTAQAVVHSIKYGGWPGVATGIAERMARLDWPEDVRRERTAIVPVPLGTARLRERGYNQSERLAVALSPHWGVPVWTDVLARDRETSSQTRLTPEERLSNVSGAFRAQVSSRIKLRGAHVVLVDDVVTTASTLNACAAALFDGGARVLSYVTFARAPAAGDR
jgi:ComF family protein